MGSNDKASDEIAAELQERLLRSVSLERLDSDLFRSVSLWTPKSGRGTFGGQLVAHSYEAAQQTIDKDLGLHIHSLHGHFLQAGNSKKPMYYRVRSIRTGKSFATRIVIATQDGKAIYTATVSFHRKEKAGLIHSARMPVVPGPDEAMPDNWLITRVVKKADERVKDNLDRKSVISLPLEVRYVIPKDIEEYYLEKAAESGMTQTPPPVMAKPDKNDLRATSLPPPRPSGEGDTNSDAGSAAGNEPMVDEAINMWQRASYKGDDPHKHQVIAAFVSDFGILFSALAAHAHHNPPRKLRMIASLDHAIYFHAPIRVDEWFLYEMRSHWAGANRALATGRIYNHKGELAMTTIQEGVIRMKPGFESNVTITSKL